MAKKEEEGRSWKDQGKLGDLQQVRDSIHLWEALNAEPEMDHGPKVDRLQEPRLALADRQRGGRDFAL